MNAAALAVDPIPSSSRRRYRRGGRRELNLSRQPPIPSMSSPLAGESLARVGESAATPHRHQRARAADPGGARERHSLRAGDRRGSLAITNRASRKETHG